MKGKQRRTQGKKPSREKREKGSRNQEKIKNELKGRNFGPWPAMTRLFDFSTEVDLHAFSSGFNLT